MINEEKEQTIWKTYPEYPFIEANQFGEIRTKDRVITDILGRKRFVKGHILKQYQDYKGYMCVQFTMSSKHYGLKVHRIVAACFIPNPNDLPQVNHIDNDRTNNFASNLEWCTNQYNSDYKKNFGTTSAEVLGHPVYAVDLKTGKVLRFETQSEAARQLGVNVGNLNAVVRGRANQTGGYWFTEDESKITEEKIQEIKDNMQSYPVFAVNLETGKVIRFETPSEVACQLGLCETNISAVVNGRANQVGGWWFTKDKNEITEEKIREIKANTLFLGGLIAIDLDSLIVSYFKSQHEAGRQLGIDYSLIGRVVRGKQPKTHGYWFCRADENAVEKVRDKFGDKIVEKVEKLMREHL